MAPEEQEPFYAGRIAAIQAGDATPRICAPPTATHIRAHSAVTAQGRREDADLLRRHRSRPQRPSRWRSSRRSN